MDFQERMRDPTVALKAAVKGVRATIWTALPGIVQSFNSAKMTAVVQPAIQINVLNKDGTTQTVTISNCVDCPVSFPRGGGVTLTFPLTSGDEGLLIFASRCIDAWWQNGGIQPQAELRMHDLSDGCFYPGVTSVPNVPTNISTTTAQLRTNDGTTLIDIDPVNHILTLEQPLGSGAIVLKNLPSIAGTLPGSLWKSGGNVRIVG